MKTYAIHMYVNKNWSRNNMEIINKQEALINRQQAAAMLGCKATTLAIWKCTNRHALPYIKIGKNIRYRVSDIKDFIEKNARY